MVKGPLVKHRHTRNRHSVATHRSQYDLSHRYPLS